MSEQSFKNRRGHNVTIREAVDDIEKNETTNQSKKFTQTRKSAKPTKASSDSKSTTIESNTQSQASNSKSKKTVKKQTHKTNQQKSKNSKSAQSSKDSNTIKKIFKNRTFKIALLVLAFAIAILILLVGLNADASKRAYDLQAATMKRSVMELSNQTASKDTLASIASTDLAKQLAADIDCDVSGVDVSSWYGRANVAKQQCQVVANDYNALKSSLIEMSEMSEYTESISKTLRPALRSPDAGAFASLTEYRDKWQETVKDIRAINPPDSMSEVHATLVENTDATRGAWQSLVEASVDEDGDKFSKTEKDLTARYANMRDIQTEILQPIQQQQLKINELVTQLTLEDS